MARQVNAQDLKSMTTCNRRKSLRLLFGPLLPMHIYINPGRNIPPYDGRDMPDIQMFIQHVLRLPHALTPQPPDPSPAHSTPAAAAA